MYMLTIMIQVRNIRSSILCIVKCRVTQRFLKTASYSCTIKQIFPDLQYINCSYIRPGVIAEKKCSKLQKTIYGLRPVYQCLKHNFHKRVIAHTHNSRSFSSLNIVFFGTDHFSLESLKGLHQLKLKGRINNLLVVTVPQKGPLHAVPKYCQEEQLSYLTWPVSLPEKTFDIGVVVSFGYLIPKSIIEAFPLGILNIHGSLLPRWRGAAPVIHAILNGDSITGITVMKIHPHRFDVGEIIYTKSMNIPPNIKSKELTEKLAKLGADCLQICLEDLDRLLTESQPQPTEGITKAPKIKDSDVFILWEKMNPALITRMFKAYDDILPLWTTWHGTPVKLRDLVMNDHNQCLSNPVLQCCDTSNNETVKQPLKSDEITSINDLDTVTNISSIDIYQYVKKIRLSQRPSKELIEEELIQNRNSETAWGRVQYMRTTKVLRVYCLKGFVEFKRVIVKGRKIMDAADFYNGFVSKVKTDKRYFF